MDAADSQNEKKEGAVPSYARPSVAARLPSYQQSQCEAIRSAFMPNSFVTIGSLGRNPVEEDFGQDRKDAFKAGNPGGSTFSEFTYTCSPYELSEQSTAAQREAHEERLAQIGQGQPFFAGYSCYKSKHEAYGVEYLSEPYDLRAEHERQERWLKESQAIAGPFRPPGVEKSLVRPTRALLGDIMTALFRSVSEDWPEAQPVVLSTAEDLVTIYFLCDRIKSANGLMAYMNNALRRNDVVIHYDLRKVPEGWGVITSDNHYLYTLRPSWVRPRTFAHSSASERSASATSNPHQGGSAANSQPASRSNTAEL